MPSIVWPISEELREQSRLILGPLQYPISREEEEEIHQQTILTYPISGMYQVCFHLDLILVSCIDLDVVSAFGSPFDVQSHDSTRPEIFALLFYHSL